jgi:hypothetical protein
MVEQQQPDRQKTAAIDTVTRRAQTAFEKWKPSLTGPIPVSVLNYLIPRRLLISVQDPESVGISIIKNDGIDTRFLILEHHDSPVTNAESMNRFKQDMRAYRQALHAGQHPTPLSFPEDVDPPHLEYPDEIKAGFITLNDRFLLEAYFSRLSSDHTHVTSYGDREELRMQGIATEFAHKLANLSRKLGGKYITGENFDSNVGFFTDKLGRSRLNDMPQDIQDTLRDNLRGEPIENFENVTVSRL